MAELLTSRCVGFATWARWLRLDAPVRSIRGHAGPRRYEDCRPDHHASRVAVRHPAGTVGGSSWEPVSIQDGVRPRAEQTLLQLILSANHVVTRARRRTAAQLQRPPGLAVSPARTWWTEFVAYFTPNRPDEALGSTQGSQ